MTKKHLVIAALLLAMIALAPVSASAAQGGVLSIPVTVNTVQNGVSSAVAGTFNITNFAVQNGKLVAGGTLNFLANGAQQVIQTAAPVSATGACPILNLSIGAIHLDLLGLVVDVAPINVQITAQSGPGNLLGNLLCAVANLLNGGGGLAGLLNQLSTLLNQILSQL